MGVIFERRCRATRFARLKSGAVVGFVRAYNRILYPRPQIMRFRPQWLCHFLPRRIVRLGRDRGIVCARITVDRIKNQRNKKKNSTPRSFCSATSNLLYHIYYKNYSSLPLINLVLFFSSFVQLDCVLKTSWFQTKNWIIKLGTRSGFFFSRRWKTCWRFNSELKSLKAKTCQYAIRFRRVASTQRWSRGSNIVCGEKFRRQKLNRAVGFLSRRFSHGDDKNARNKGEETVSRSSSLFSVFERAS